jgi:hypothetical protein
MKAFCVGILCLVASVLAIPLLLVMLPFSIIHMMGTAALEEFSADAAQKQKETT